MTGELFALGNAVAQAGSNVSAGAAARRSSPMTVLLIATPVTVVVALIIAIASGAPASMPSLVWGLLAGVAGGIGLNLSYRAFTLGRIAVVVPVITCAGTIGQVVASWLLEGPPALGTLGGALVCLAAVAVISLQRGEPDAGANPTRAVALGVAAGACFVTFVVLLAQGADQSATWSLAAARIGVLSVVVVMALLLRHRPTADRRTAGTAMLAGTLDITSNLLLLAALAVASLALVAAVVAVAPVIAALMAITFLRERLQRRQVLGLALALLGVWLVVLA